MRKPKKMPPYAAPREDAETTVVFDSLAGLTPSVSPLCGGDSSVAQLGSDSGDDFVEKTGVSDFIGDLARLADPSCVPRLNRELSRAEILSPPEAFVASLVTSNMNMQAILDMSPLDEDDTLRFLARLVEKGLITLKKGRGLLGVPARPGDSARPAAP